MMLTTITIMKKFPPPYVYVDLYLLVGSEVIEYTFK